jgi:hypothetical protein
MPLVSHAACYRLLLGVVNAVAEDPDRRAAFEADHPTEPYTRQKAATGMPEPVAQISRDYGEVMQRSTTSASQKAAGEAVEAAASVGPTLGELRLRNASILLINEESLRELAAGSAPAEQMHHPQLARQLSAGRRMGRWF